MFAVPQLENLFKGLVEMAMEAEQLNQFLNQSVFKLFKGLIIQDAQRKNSGTIICTNTLTISIYTN